MKKAPSTHSQNHLLKFHSFLNKPHQVEGKPFCLLYGTGQQPIRKLTSLKHRPIILWKLCQSTRNAFWFTQLMIQNWNCTITEQWQTQIQNKLSSVLLCTQVLTLQLLKLTLMKVVLTSESTTMFTVVWKMMEQL